MLRLRPYIPDDAREIVRWTGSEYAFHQWSANCFDQYPLTPQALNDYYESRRNSPDYWQMTAVDEDGPAGHLIMRYPGESREVLRFGFVIVDSGKRGRGYGKELVTLAIRYAFDCAQAQKIMLAVFANNLPAMECYRACGFRPAAEQGNTDFPCMGEVWQCITMELGR